VALYASVFLFLAPACLGARLPTGIVFISTNDIHLQVFSVAPDGSGKRQLTHGDTMSAWAEGSPDGKRIVFASIRDGALALLTMDADGANQQSVFDFPAGDMDPTWSPDSQHLAFVRYVAPGDPRIYTSTADGQDERDLQGRPDMAWSPSWAHTGGKIAYVRPFHGIAVVDARTERSELVIPGGGSAPTWSADGGELAYVRWLADSTDIYVSDLEGENTRQLTNHPAHDREPAWSPDGATILFESRRDRDWNLYAMDPDGGNLRRVTDEPTQDYGPSWLGGGQLAVAAVGRRWLPWAALKLRSR